MEVPGYNASAYEQLVAAMWKLKELELPGIARLEGDQDNPISVIMAGLTLARHLADGAEAQPDFHLMPDMSQLQIQDSLNAHATKLLKKRGIKGKAVLCDVGAAHLPRSDGVPVSVPTVSPKDVKVLTMLGESKSVAEQRSSLGLKRSNSFEVLPFVNRLTFLLHMCLVSLICINS